MGHAIGATGNTTRAAAPPSLPSERHPTTTLLVAAERATVDRALNGLPRALHRESIDEVRGDISSGRAGHVLVSLARAGEMGPGWIAHLVRDFPRVPVVALVSHHAVETPRLTLALGNAGVRTLVDVRRGDGIEYLRETLAPITTRGIEHLALTELEKDLDGAPEDCIAFFRAIFENRAPRPTTVREIARRCCVNASTVTSRFDRAALPSAKRYLAYARLVLAARALEDPGMPLGATAYRLEYSSSQSFSRHIRIMLGISGMDFRTRYDGEGMLQRFREELVLPYLETLREFRPFARPQRRND